MMPDPPRPPRPLKVGEWETLLRIGGRLVPGSFGLKKPNPEPDENGSKNEPWAPFEESTIFIHSVSDSQLVLVLPVQFPVKQS
jgi:hypothetical protein